jgi:trehalose 6-phosphate phosphatase
MSVALGGLDERLDAAACAPRLLVACDFDGTLSDLVDDPARARPRALADRAIDVLAAQPNTLVGVVSGRGLDDLRSVLGPRRHTEGVRLFGSHGLEADDGTMIGMARAVSLGRDGLIRQAQAIVADVPGSRAEAKPYGVAIHLRGLGSSATGGLVRSVRGLLRERPGVFVKTGKQVVELSVLPFCKAFAVDMLQHQWVPDVTVYAGDDRTDEDVFTSMWPGDISIKIGEGETAAPYRVRDPEQFERLLWRLAERRGRILAGWPTRT